MLGWTTSGELPLQLTNINLEAYYHGAQRCMQLKLAILGQEGDRTAKKMWRTVTRSATHSWSVSMAHHTPCHNEQA